MQVRLIGHRGSGASDAEFNRTRDMQADTPRQTENTIVSHVLGMNGADGVETDLIPTRKCRNIALTHSNDFSQHVFRDVPLPHKFAIGERSFIDQFSDEEIQRYLSIGRSGLHSMPMLGELLEAAKRGYPETFLHLELKGVQDTRSTHQRPSKGWPTLAQTTCEIIDEAGWPMQQTRFSSFALSYLEEMLHTHSRAPLALLCDLPQEQGGDVGILMFADRPDVYLPFTPQTLDMAVKRLPTLSAVHPEVQSLTPEAVERAAAYGLDIAVWGWKEYAWNHPGQVGAHFGDCFKRAVDLCDRYGIHRLDIITDHIGPMQQLLGLRPVPAPAPAGAPAPR